MDNVYNFRDLGGIPTADGRRVKHGLFFRSAFLDEASEEDINYLKSLHLKRIFDYRDVSEVNKDNDIKYKKIGGKHLHYPNNIVHGKVYKLQNGGFKRAFLRIKPEDVREFYSYLPIRNIGYQSMADALKNGDVPFLQHCTAGKDRAGIGAAILLRILGVSYDEALKDYLVSLSVHDYIKDKMIGNLPKFVIKMIEDNYEAIFTVDASYFKASFDAIDNEYGSFENYVRQELKLTDDNVNAIRARYTE